MAMNAMKEAMFVVQGGNRGIGLGIVNDLLKRSKGFVVASCRRPDVDSFTRPSEELSLRNLQKEYGNRLSIIQLDVTSDQSISNAFENVKEIAKHRIGREKIDLLFNASGLLHDTYEPSHDGSKVKGPERSVKELDRDWMMQNYHVNCVGQLLVSKAFLPLLFPSKENLREEDPMAVIASISARVGSIGDNGLGGWYSYRMSKAALNMGMKNLSIELSRMKRQRQSVVVCLHPGTVETDLSSPFQKGVARDKLFSVEYSSKCMLDVLESLKPEDSGCLLAYDGQKIEW